MGVKNFNVLSFHIGWKNMINPIVLSLFIDKLLIANKNHVCVYWSFLYGKVTIGLGVL
jgi:hypothetical protein